MSTLEKAIKILQKMPEYKLEIIYMYIRFIDSQNNNTESAATEDKETDSIRKKQKAFQDLISFAGTLPENFDYKKELEEAREAKYDHFI